MPLFKKLHKLSEILINYYSFINAKIILIDNNCQIFFDFYKINPLLMEMKNGKSLKINPKIDNYCQKN